MGPHLCLQSICIRIYSKSNDNRKNVPFVHSGLVDYEIADNKYTYHTSSLGLMSLSAFSTIHMYIL